MPGDSSLTPSMPFMMLALICSTMRRIRSPLMIGVNSFAIRQIKPLAASAMTRIPASSMPISRSVRRLSKEMPRAGAEETISRNSPDQRPAGPS